MSALSETQVVGFSDVMKQIFARALWEWITTHGDEKVTLRVWIIRKTFTIRDLENVFALLLGPKPEYM